MRFINILREWCVGIYSKSVCCFVERSLQPYRDKLINLPERSHRYSNFHWSVWLNGVKIYLSALQGACSFELVYTESDWEKLFCPRFTAGKQETFCTFIVKRSLDWSNQKKILPLPQTTKEYKGNPISFPEVKTKATHLVGDLFVQWAPVATLTFSAQKETTMKVRAWVTCYLYDFWASAPIGRQANRSNSLLCLTCTCFAMPTHKHARCSWDFSEILRFIPCIACKSTEVAIRICTYTSQDDQTTRVWRIL